MTRVWDLTEEVPNEDGTPTGRYFVYAFRPTGDTDAAGNPELAPSTPPAGVLCTTVW